MNAGIKALTPTDAMLSSNYISDDVVLFTKLNLHAAAFFRLTKDLSSA